VESGKFSFNGKVNSAGEIIFTQEKWIKGPEYFTMVDLEGKLSGLNTIIGTIIADGCGAFKVIKL
jgi:hypothetical protein